METIAEKNKLIAGYMYPEWVHPKEQDEDWEKLPALSFKEIAGDSYFVMAQLLMEDYESLKYHKSYDALMPVLKHIQNDASVKIDHYKESTGWYAYYSMETLVACEDIEKVYEEIIRYIVWYNEFIKKH